MAVSLSRWLSLTLWSAAAAAQAGDITLYTRAQFGGPAIQLHGSEPDLGKLGFNDRASSVIVQSGTWEVCENKHYQGKCLVLQPGEYATLKNFNDMMSSVREIEAGPAANPSKAPPSQRVPAVPEQPAIQPTIQPTVKPSFE